MCNWIINKEQTENCFLVLKDKKGWYKATVRFDGCVDLSRLHNIPLPITRKHPQLVDYIHYCDIDDEIKRLEALRDKAKEFFGEDWNT